MSFWQKMFGGAAKPAPPPTAATPAPAAEAPRALTLERVVLYQADEEIRARMQASDAVLKAYIDRVIDAADAFWREAGPGTGRLVTLIVALKPGAQTRFWLESEPGGLDAGKVQALCERLARVPPPLVLNGPVALALQGSLWGATGPVENWPTLPREWAEACHHRSLLVPDGVLEVVWPD